jgi:hypothetical protein
MLNLGSTPTSYSRKTGDKMVLPQPKKNWIDTVEQGGSISDLSDTTATNRVRSKSTFSISPNKSYTISAQENNRQVFIWYQKLDGSYSGTGVNGGWNNMPITFSLPDVKKIRLVFRKSDDSNIIPNEITPQLEEGTTATPYSPYAIQLNKKPQRKTTAKTGLSFNGVTDYVTVNNEIGNIGLNDFVFESKVTVKSYTSNGRIFDKNGGNFAFSLDMGQVKIWCGAWYLFNYTVPLNTPTKLRVVRVNQTSLNLYVNDVFVQTLPISSFNISNSGTLFIGSATPTGNLLNGIIQFVRISSPTVNLFYDFENPRNIVGNQVIPNAQNLIPSFEDSRWSIHQNAKVMGKDVLHLDATASNQYSELVIDVKPNTSYLVNVEHNGQIAIWGYTINGWINNLTTSKTIIFNSGTNTKIGISLRNLSGVGSFDFIRPQLYQLTGQEGTINGAPILQFKHAKRRLYNKR